MTNLAKTKLTHLIKQNGKSALLYLKREKVHTLAQVVALIKQHNHGDMLDWQVLLQVVNQLQ